MRLSLPFCARGAALVLALGMYAAPAPAQQPAETADAEARDYLSANGLLARGMNELAAKEYRQFLEQHPKHERAPQARYGLGVALSRQKQWEPALAALEPLEKVEKFEFAAEAGVLRAQCLMALGKFAEAAAPLTRVVEKNGEHELADDAAALLVEARHRAGDFKEVEPARKLLEERWPKSPLRDRAEFFAGLALLSLEKPAEAGARFEGIEKQWPESPLAPQATLLAAQSLHRAGEGAKAERLYQRVIEKGEKQSVPAALLGLASLERAAGKPEDAQRSLDRLLSEFGESEQSAEAYLERGRARLDAGDAAGAGKDFAKYASSAKADAAQADFWRARADSKQVKHSRAAERLRAALGREGGGELRPLMRLDLAGALLAAGEDEGAAAELERFRADYKDHPQWPEATEALATLRHRKGDYRASEALCKEFRDRAGEHALRARVDFLSAENAFLSGDLKGAARAYEAFVSEHPKDANAGLARFRLGCAWYRDGAVEQAKPLLAEAAESAGENAAMKPALLYLGDLEYQAGDWAGAEKHLRAYLASGGPTGSELAAADDAVLKLGLALHRQGNESGAVEQYERLLKEFPRSEHRGLAAFERGRSLLASGKREECKSQFQDIAKGSDSHLAAMALVQLGSIASLEGRDEDAAKQFAGAVERGDKEAQPDALLGLGAVRLARGETKEAGEALERMIREFPSHPRAGEAKARLALVQARQAPDGSALAGLDAALREKDLRPDLREALAYERAVCLRKAGKTAEADEAMKGVASGAKGPAVRVSAALEMARAQSEAKMFDEALATLRGVEQDLGSGGVPAALRENAEYQMGACEFRLGHAKEGAARFEKFLSDHAKSELAGSAALLAGECRRQLKQPKKAAAHLKTALDAKLSESDQQTAMLRLGECLADVQDWKGSEDAFGQFLERFPKSELWFQARFGRGWAIENQSRPEDAIAEYHKVVAAHQGPTAARAQFQIGECLFGQNKHEDAVRELLKVDILYAYPEWSAAALYEAGRCFEAMGKPEDAKTQFEAVHQKHGDTKWAPLAAERLASLGKSAGGGAARPAGRARNEPD